MTHSDRTRRSSGDGGDDASRGGSWFRRHPVWTGVILLAVVVLVIPMAVPLLIFGAGSLATGGEAGLALTAAVSLVLVALSPFAAGAAIRAARG